MIWQKQIIFVVAIAAMLGIIATLGAFSRRMFKKGSELSFTLTSPSFEHDTSIPPFYTCDGRDVSPTLVWQNAPADTKSFTLILHDPDALGGDWIHWIVYDIPSTLFKLEEHTVVKSIGAKEGMNSAGQTTYEGPCPPLKEHRYIFTIYALNVPQLMVKRQPADYDMVMKAMENHILDKAILMGTYQRIKSI